MTDPFTPDVVAQIAHHMNGDHADDNLLIVRAFSPESEVIAATMIGFDGDGGEWRAQPLTGEEFVVRVPWPGGHIVERAEVRREIVALYDESCRRLGLQPRPHA